MNQAIAEIEAVTSELECLIERGRKAVASLQDSIPSLPHSRTKIPPRTHVGMYRFYNMGVGQFGQPFSLCDGCRREQRVPALCVLEKIAAPKSKAACERCGAMSS